MSGGGIDYLPEASRELEDALEWYLERSLQAAEAFVRETERAVAVIAAAPRVWPRFEAGTRRYVLTGFPYNLIYRETDVGIEIVAVAHHKRRPGIGIAAYAAEAALTRRPESAPPSEPLEAPRMGCPRFGRLLRP